MRGQALVRSVQPAYQLPSLLWLQIAARARPISLYLLGVGTWQVRPFAAPTRRSTLPEQDDVGLLYGAGLRRVPSFAASALH